MPRYKINLIIEEIEKDNYHLFIELKIGKQPCRLLVDTGASKTVFDKSKVLKFVKKKKIMAADSRSTGLGVSEIKTKVVDLKSIRIGKMKVNKFHVAVLDLSHVNESYKQIKLPEVDGVLGSDFLMKFQAVINYPKSKLSLSK